MNAGRIVELGPTEILLTPAPIYPNSAPSSLTGSNQRIWRSMNADFKLIGNTTPGWLL